MREEYEKKNGEVGEVMFVEGRVLLVILGRKVMCRVCVKRTGRAGV